MYEYDHVMVILVKPVVWESKERHEAGARTVLDPIGSAGQEILLGFIGDCRYPRFVEVHNMVSENVYTGNI